MKRIGAGVLMVVGVVAVVALTLITAWAKDGQHGVLVDDSVSRGSSWKVSCPTVDGGTDVDMLLNVDGGANMGPVTDLTVLSTSTTCVRVGLDSTVDSTHGAPVGAGCAGGTSWPTHAKGGRCQSTGAAVVVDVVGGRP